MEAMLPSFCRHSEQSRLEFVDKEIRRVLSAQMVGVEPLHIGRKRKRKPMRVSRERQMDSMHIDVRRRIDPTHIE